MAERKAFLLRVDPALLEAVQRWADDDLRSLNGQIEYLLRQALQRAGRQPASGRSPAAGRDPDAKRAAPGRPRDGGGR
ncbi:MAG: hypothetical protein R2708_06135 [Vicinamibacterales bacterium]